MFDTILVALDRTDQDIVALSTATDQARRHNAQLVLMYVAERSEPCSNRLVHGGPALPVETDTCEECLQATDYLNDLRRQGHVFGDVEVVLRSGDPVHQIEKQADRYLHPLVVMSIAAEPENILTVNQQRAIRLLQRGRHQLMLAVRPVDDEFEYIDEIHESAEVYVGITV